jgi:hydrogenase-4 component E
MNILDFLVTGAAVLAILMAGSGQLRLNLILYSLQTICLACATITQSNGAEFLYSALAIVIVKGLAVPYFLTWVIRKIDVHNDPGTILPIPISMHAAIIFLALGHFLARSLPQPVGLADGTAGVTAAISLLLTGILFMLTRRVALSQVIGFLTMENGIYLFAVTETKGMPMVIEMGALLDVLVAVMIAGLIIFRIKKSFEHIDVTQLTALREN